METIEPLFLTAEEVETLTGYVVRTAQELGIEVPTYQFMYKGLTEFPYPVAD